LKLAIIRKVIEKINAAIKELTKYLMIFHLSHREEGSEGERASKSTKSNP